MVEKSIPKPVLERFIVLLRLLKQIKREGTAVYVTSADIERLTGWSRDTVRKDISFLKPTLRMALCATEKTPTSQGYEVSQLHEALHTCLQLDEMPKKCCIVGLGRLGSAFLEYEGFSEGTINVVAGFDSNINRVEILHSRFALYSTSRMEQVISNEGITLAILCVPRAVAQATADRLIDCGITGIVNFTPAVLTVPSYVEVEHVSAVDALCALISRQACKREKR